VAGLRQYLQIYEELKNLKIDREVTSVAILSIIRTLLDIRQDGKTKINTNSLKLFNLLENISRRNFIKEDWRLQRGNGGCKGVLQIAKEDWRLQRRTGDCKGGLEIAKGKWRLQRGTEDCKGGLEIANGYWRFQRGTEDCKWGLEIAKGK
jgi:hypothetical protein